MKRMTGKAGRRIAIWSAVALGATVVPGVALGDEAGPERGKHGRHGSGLSVAGRAMSQGENDVWGMAIRAHQGEGGEAQGWVRFGHRGAEASDGLAGEVRCLSKDSAGVIQVSGTVHGGGSKPNRKQKDDGPGQASPTPSADPAAPLDELSGQGEPSDPERKRGGELAGKDFAFTIDVPGNPQHFSLPRLADAGTLPACSAGAESVPVTRGGFRSTQTQS